MKYFIALALFALSSTTLAEAAGSVVHFEGACDASGAVPLNNGEFMIADDEDNILRVYNAKLGGAPIATIALNQTINPSLPAKSSRTIPAKKELDLEAATRIGDISFWLTSHARNKKGKFKPERFNFFALQHKSEDQQVVAFGQPVENFIEALINHPQYRHLNLKDAAKRPAEAYNGLNIEGMTAAFDGGVIIGFRNPLPDNKAIIATLKNPHEVVNGQAPIFGDNYLLDLNGLGIRGLSAWHGDYLIAAGGANNQSTMQLLRWRESMSKPEVIPLKEQLPKDFNPEAFFTPESRRNIMLLSDDGSRKINGAECKKLKNPRLRSFRGVWLNIEK